MADKGLVLVTGGSGYIAGYCIAQLLREGWQVRTTLRSLAGEAAVRSTIRSLGEPDDRLTFRAADLTRDEGWATAAEGCEYVLHVASPLPSRNPRDEDELIRPARDGALRVLRAARDAKARRVVMTSSTAAICYGRGSYDVPATEERWSDETNRGDTSAYERSKTLAERAAWAWHRAEGAGLELTTICPGAVLGPVLGSDYSASIDIVKKQLDGSLPGLPRFGWPLIDVRDVADLHVRAMTAPEAAGERFLAAGPFFWMSDVAASLASRLPEMTKRVPKRRLPDWLIRILARFDPVVRDRLFELGKHRPASSAKAGSMLGWKPRDSGETIADTARSLLDLGLVKRT